MKLGDCAKKIKIGCMLSRFESQTDESFKALTLGCIDGFGRIDHGLLKKIQVCGNVSNYLTKENDVILRLAQIPNYAAYITADDNGLLVSSKFAIISADDSRLLPEFLTWYINSGNLEPEFAKNRTGSTIVSLNIGNLKNMELSLPSLEEQRRVAEIARLSIDKISYQQRKLAILKKENAQINALLSQKFLRR